MLKQHGAVTYLGNWGVSLVFKLLAQQLKGHGLVLFVLPSLRLLALVENGPIVPVHLGHRSRLPNRDPLLGTNAGPGSSTNRDREVSTWTS
jgi:hypothetical protein